jgi:chromosome segregation ATPase
VGAVQAQCDEAHHVLNQHAKDAKSATAAQASTSARERSLNNQLAARQDEISGLKDELALVAGDAESWRCRGTELVAQLATALAAKKSEASRAGVLAKQLQMREEEMGALREQLAVVNEGR